MVKTIDLIGKTLHPSHLKSEYYFTNRSLLMSKLLEWLKVESAAKTPSFEIFSSILSERMTVDRVGEAALLLPPLPLELAFAPDFGSGRIWVTPDPFGVWTKFVSTKLRSRWKA